MTITHSSFAVELDEIISEIKKLSKNSYVEKYVNVPDIAYLRLQLFNLSLFHANIPQKLRNLYCVTSGLVQLGLDLHECISNQKETQEKGIRNRQLSILAGDYFSSQYYSLLSKTNQTDVVKRLALGIRNINTAKMRLYTNNATMNHTLEQYLDLIKLRESNLYVQFLDKYLSEDHRSFWKFMIENMILLFSLSEELQEKFIKRNHLSYFLVNYYSNSEEKKEIQDLPSTEISNRMKNLSHKYDIKGKIIDIMQTLYDDISNRISKMEDRVVQGELIDMLNQFYSSFHRSNAMEKL